MKTLALVLALLAPLFVGCSTHEHHNGGNEATQTASSSEDYYTCPMHPSVRSSKPGACPICGMTLVKRSSQVKTTERDSSTSGSVHLSPRDRLLANVSTSVVRRGALHRGIDIVGVIDIAEPNLRHITMRFPGRLERLYLTYTGQIVHKGDPVAEVYSPEAISAQQEFLLASQQSGSHEGMDSTMIHNPSSLAGQSRQKLLLWGFTTQQIDELLKGRRVNELITIFSPITGTVVKKNVDPQHYASTGEVIYDVADLSTVWMNADVYEQDIRFIHVGQGITITSEAYPAESFSGKVAFIDPVMNGETRTIRIRTEFNNSSGKLKPQMFVAATINVEIPNVILIPSSAVLSTGKRTVAWIETSADTFEPRDVVLGARSDSTYQVLSGVREGESVVVTGGFLIDSESALRTPSTAEPHAGHSKAM